MNTKLEERIKSEVKMQIELNKDLSKAIAEVLKEHGVKGKYIFNVRKDPDYCQEPIKYLNGKELRVPLFCMGSGCATVEEPYKVERI